MYIDYMLFTVIALVTGVLILFRILSSNMKNQEKGFLQLIILAVCHNIIDIFWGLTYFDKIGMGPMGLKISTSMYFCSNAILSFTWFTFLYRLMSREKIQKWVIVLATIPLVTVFFMVIANIWTVIKFVKSKEKSERKKNAIFTLFAVIPMTFDFLQVFFVSVPCTSVAFQIAIIIIYAFISVEISNVSFVREVIGTSGEAQKALNMIEGC